MKVAIPFLIFIVVLTGCTREYENLIKGRWNKVSYEANPVHEEVWSFENDGSVYRIRYYFNNNETDTMSEGTYLIKNKTLTIAGPIYPFDTPFFKGDFSIDKLNDEVLIIYQNSVGLEYQEFVKEN